MIMVINISNRCHLLNVGCMEFTVLGLDWNTSACNWAQFFDVEIAVERLKSYKSLFSDQIPAELVQAGGSWNNEELSEQCKKSIIAPVCKKDDETDCRNCRRILVINFYKLLFKSSKTVIRQMLITFRTLMLRRRGFCSILALKSLSHVRLVKQDTGDRGFVRDNTRTSVHPALDSGPRRVFDVSSSGAPPWLFVLGGAS
jgi:hypothetical protein